MDRHPSEAPRRLLTFWAGGVHLLIACALVLGVALHWGLRPGEGPRVGDGRDPASYGFDLEPRLVPWAALEASGRSRDGIRIIEQPILWDLETLDREHERSKFLVPDDLVLGLRLGGQARAYPLRVLSWHEIAWDTLGGVPVAVTYNPLSGCAAVFDRRLGEHVMEPGHSGLLLNSTLLMYDRSADGESRSLWSQVLGRAVTGPSVGQQLRLLPGAVLRWERWRHQHPDTTVLGRDPRYRKLYRREPYSTYRARQQPRFRVLPEPGEHPFEPLLVLCPSEGAREAMPLETLQAAVGEEGQVTMVSAGVSLTLHVDPGPPLTAWVDGAGPVPAFCCYRFAWDSLQER